MSRSKDKPFKLKPRERVFLQKIDELKDIGDAYLGSGYNCKNKEVACVAGSRLLRRINENMPHRDIGQTIIGVQAVYQRTKELMVQDTDKKAAVKAADLAGQFIGMKDQLIPSPAGIQIAIIQRIPEGKEQGRVDATQEAILISQGSKPLALKD